MAQKWLSTKQAEALREHAQQQGFSVDELITTWLSSADAGQQTRASWQAHFFDLSLDLLCMVDANAHILLANSAFANLLGIKAAALVGQSLLDLMLAADRKEAEGVFSNLTNPFSPGSFTCRFRGFDGTARWYLWTIYQKMPGIFHAVGKDITPYKEMEVQEAERNIFAEALLDTVLTINTSLALEQVLERILSNVGKVVAYDYVSIMLVEGRHAEVVAFQTRQPHGISVNLAGSARFDIQDHEYLNLVYTQRDCIIVPEVAHPPAWMMSDSPAVPGSFLGAPIVVEDVVIGFLGVFNCRTEFFTPLHAQQLVTFANQAGIAINNARLYEQAQSAAILRERQRMAQELHDSVNQDLFAASTYADLLPKALARKPEVVARYAIDISRLVRSAVAQMRMILIELHPDTLTTTELQVLIKQLCAAFTNRSGIAVEFKTNCATILEQDDQIAIYRIAQETLHNINKHADAKTVTVQLLLSESHLELIITDDGAGFDFNSITEIHLGIRGMRERAVSIGASIAIQTEPGQGTQITLRKNYS
jgi:PAS domain S-box-containing protein